MIQRVKIVLLILLFVSCSKEVAPTVENINTIFASKDFTFEFIRSNGDKESLSFRNDYLVYKSDKPTYRREISYEEVILLNEYIQRLVRLHSETLDPSKTSHYIIKNTAYKVVIVPKQEDFYFDALLKTLQLDQ